jgi:hypothetical protein
MNSKVAFRQTIATLLTFFVVYGIGGIAVFFVMNIWQEQYAPYGGTISMILYWGAVTALLIYLNILMIRAQIGSD